MNSIVHLLKTPRAPAHKKIRPEDCISSASYKQPKPSITMHPNSAFEMPISAAMDDSQTFAPAERGRKTVLQRAARESAGWFSLS